MLGSMERPFFRYLDDLFPSIVTKLDQNLADLSDFVILPIAYELVGHEYWAGDSRWDRRTLFKGIEARDGGGPVQGVVLFEVLADQQLRVEIFPGATAAQVDGFTEAALIYER